MGTARRQREYIGYRVYSTQRALYRSLEACVAEAGLTPGQWNALSQLAEHGAMTQRQLAERLQKEQATVTRSLDRLMQRGLVQRTQNPRDRRANIVEITPAALKLLTDLEPSVTRRNAEMAANISDEDLAVFLKVLDQLEVNAERSTGESEAS